jgi:hypothetical protein
VAHLHPAIRHRRLLLAGGEVAPVDKLPCTLYSSSVDLLSGLFSLHRACIVFLCFYSLLLACATLYTLNFTMPLPIFPRLYIALPAPCSALVPVGLALDADTPGVFSSSLGWLTVLSFLLLR